MKYNKMCKFWHNKFKKTRPRPLTGLLTGCGLLGFSFLLLLFQLFYQVHYFFPTIESTRRAHCVTSFQSLAIFTLGKTRTCERVVRTPVFRMRFCMSHSYYHNGSY